MESIISNEEVLGAKDSLSFVEQDLLKNNVLSQPVIILIDEKFAENASIPSAEIENANTQIILLSSALVVESNDSDSIQETANSNCTQKAGIEVKIEDRLQALDAILSTCDQQAFTPKNVDANITSNILKTNGEYICDLCGSVFGQATQYYGHLHTHVGERNWKCEKCPDGKSVFDSLSRLRKHEKMHHEMERLHKCDSCDATFHHASQVKYHKQWIHDQHRAFPCCLCNKAFYKKSDLRSHLTIHLSLQNCVCEVCGRAFSHISNLIRHSRLHTGVKPYPCTVCGRRFAQLTSLKQHKISHENLSLPCPARPLECNKVFRSPLLARKHAKQMHPDVWKDQVKSSSSHRRKFYCTVCGESFSFASNMREHQQKHKNATCSDCGHEFNTVEDLKVHECVAEPGRQPAGSQVLQSEPDKIPSLNSTTECDSIDLNDIDNLPDFTSQAATGLETSFVTSVGQTAVTFETNPESEICEKSLEQIDLTAQLESLLKSTNTAANCDPSEVIIYITQDNTPHQVHVEPLHDLLLSNVLTSIEPPSQPIQAKSIPALPSKDKILPPKSRQCIECGKHFEKSSNLKQHLGTHFVELKRYNCDLCGQSFAWKSTLNKHMVTHEKNSRPKVACPTCNKQYSSSALVQDHIKRDHLQQKPHSCHVCSKAFFKKHDLQIHIRVHTKEKPYMCGTCGKTFYHISHMKRHELTHGGVKQHQCDVCGIFFSQSSGLKAHKQRSVKCNVEAQSSQEEVIAK